MLAVAIGLMLAGLAPAAGSPLAPAVAGMIECSQPDDRAKTCGSMTKYQVLPDGTWQETAETMFVLPPANQLVSIEAPAVGRLKGAELCGMVTAEDLAHAKVRENGVLLDDDKAQPILATLIQILSPGLGKEICETYRQDVLTISETATIDGVQQPSTKIIEWVRPDAGYKVRP